MTATAAQDKTEDKASATKIKGMTDDDVKHALRRGQPLPSGSVLVAHTQSQTEQEILDSATERAKATAERVKANAEADKRLNAR